MFLAHAQRKSRKSSYISGTEFERLTGGRGTVRATLYMAAFNSIRWNWQIREFYQRLRQAGKPFKVAIVACMRKLLGILNALVRNNTIWRNSPINP